jgi:tetratricopeptide (TPR) repeat protein/O-antigen ligase
VTISRKAGVLYLVREAVLILVVSYLLFFGGTLNGLAAPQTVWATVGLVGGVSLVWLGWCVWRRRRVETPPLWAPILALVLAYVLTGFASMDPRRSLNAIWVLVLEVWVFLLVYDMVKRGWPAELFVKVLLILGVVVVAFVFWQLLDWERQWLAIGGWSSPFPPVWLRPSPFYTHANLVAAFTNLLWPLALVWLWDTRSRLTRLWCGLVIAGCGIVIVFSSSRGALLAAGGALALMSVLAIVWQRQAFLSFAARLMRSRWQIALAALPILAAGAGASVLIARVLAHPTHGTFWGSRAVFWQAALAAFRRSPLLGSGPGTFASDYLNRVSVPPQFLYPHAHSMPLQLAAETGAVGLVSGAWLVVALIVAAVRRWRCAPLSERRLIAGLCGALATTGLHGLVDSPTLVPAIAMMWMLLAALLLSIESPERPVRISGERPAGTAMAVLAALFVVGGGVWMQHGYAPYYYGAALANASAWAEALPSLEEATRRDVGHAYYHLQAGFAHGMVASEGDVTQLPQAIVHYRQGIAREPYYSLNHANLAVLLWQQGEREAAIDAMQRAAELAPDEAAYPLNLGVFFETEGDTARAVELYQRALDLRPTWAAAYFWRASEARSAALRAWQATQSAEPPASGGEEALAQSSQVIRENPADPVVYLGQAKALIGLGRWAEAEHALRMADLVARGGGSAISAESCNEIGYYQALVAYQQGRSVEAIHMLEQVLGQVRDQTLFGPGGEGASLYGWGVFYRVGWEQDVLPGLQIIRFTDEQVNRLLLLGQWYESAGDAASARRVYHEVLEVAPDTAQAAERLAALGEQ